MALCECRTSDRKCNRKLFRLTVPDLTPNVGVFWYFFTEMFEHFHLLFLWTFQLNLIVYVVPLALVLKLGSLHLSTHGYFS